MLPLVLYDVPSKLPGNSWSPNPAKPRFVLNYKKLPFETVWVEFPDIAPKLKEIGASPNKNGVLSINGSERYTVPVLSDPNTGAIVTDSWVIAEYLEKTYPEKPIFPNGSKGLINTFDSALTALILEGGAIQFSLLRSSEILNERSRKSFITARGPFIGDNVDEWSPEGPVRDAHLAIMENKFHGSMNKWYEQVEGKWLMGDTLSYADIILAAHLFWFKRVYRDDEWKRVASMHNGRWERLLADAEKECNLA